MNALAVALGAAIGALIRWSLGLGLNAIWPALPLGTLVANWVGAYLVGVLAALINVGAALSEPVRLLLITGLLGGLTTFSTFSIEAVSLLQRQLYGAAFWHISLHVVGSLLLTFAGYASVQAIRG